MCGITGIFNFNNLYTRESGLRLVSNINSLLRHRGPDAHGTWSADDDSCFLGHTRLSVIDLDSRSNQPMQSADNRYVISFNGEIYNFQTIKQKLISTGHKFKTNSDTEVILEGFCHYGEALFPQLDGMFALAIYDTKTKKLLLARDRMGEKPLYVAKLIGAIAFCSELKPLLTLPELDKKVSQESLFEYLTLRYVLDPNTIFSHIHSIQPGTFKIIDNKGSVSEKSYFSFDIEQQQFRNNIDPDEYINSLENSLCEAVATRLVADVPVGAFLSSGVDSSLVCSIAAKKLDSNVKCFSAGFVGGKDNETDHAERISKHLGLPFEQYLVSPDDMLDIATKFGELLDEPNGDRSCVPTYFLSQLISSQVTVAVSGDGGDELFAGYGRYQPFPKKQDSKSEIDRVCDYFSQRLPVFPLKELIQLLPEQYAVFRQRVAGRFSTAFSRSDLEDVERLRLTDAYSYLPGAVLAKVDRMSMQHSLEVRTPFFSPSTLYLSRNLPANLCTDGVNFKLALRKLLSRYLPQELIRPGKQGFGMPASFFQNHVEIFQHLANQSDQILEAWEPFTNNKTLFLKVRDLSRSNINSLWAWIVLGQWSNSLPNVAEAPSFGVNRKIIGA